MITDQSFSQRWHRQPSCPSGCKCALRVIETVPSGYSAVSASTNTPTKYYYAGSARIAMRTGTGGGTTGLKWLLTDHLGSTSITADGATGAKLSELRYKPWGELRYASQPTPTGLRFTGQRFTGQRMEGIGLYDYGARWYDNRCTNCHLTVNNNPWVVQTSSGV